VKVRAVLLYMAGLSYRDITYVLRVVPCSHEAVRLWVKKLEQEPGAPSRAPAPGIPEGSAWRAAWGKVAASAPARSMLF